MRAGGRASKTREAARRDRLAGSVCRDRSSEIESKNFIEVALSRRLQSLSSFLFATTRLFGEHALPSAARGDDTLLPCPTTDS